MQKEVVEILTRVVVAFATFVGVGGTMAYYMREIINITRNQIIFALLIYISISIFIVLGVERELK